MAVQFIEVLSVKEFANTSTGSLKDSTSGDIACDAKIQVSFNGSTYWLPLYDTAS